GDGVNDDVLVQVVEVVLLDEEAMAGPCQAAALGEPLQRMPAVAVDAGADPGAGGDAERHEEDRRDRLDPLELGVRERRGVADLAGRWWLEAAPLGVDPVAALGARQRQRPPGRRERRVVVLDALLVDGRARRLDPLGEPVRLERLAGSVEEAREDGEEGKDHEWRRDPDRRLVRPVVMAMVVAVAVPVIVVAAATVDAVTAG